LPLVGMGAEGVAVLVGVAEGVAVKVMVAVGVGVAVIGEVAVGNGLEAGPVTLAVGRQAIGKIAKRLNTAKINFFIKPSNPVVF